MISENNIPAEKNNEKICIDSLRKVFTSPIAVLSVISYFLVIIFKVLRALVNPFALVDKVSAVISEFYTDFQTESVAKLAKIVLKIASLMGVLPSVIVLVGILVTFFSALGKKDSISTGGLLTIKIMRIINLSGLILLYMAGTVGMLLGITAISNFLNTSGNSFLRKIASGGGIVLAVIFVIATLFFVFELVYNIKFLATINAFRKTIKRKTFVSRASLFVTVCNFILAERMLVTAGLNFLFKDYLGVLIAFFSMFSYIFFGTLFINYKLKAHDYLLRQEISGEVQDSGQTEEQE